MRRRLDAASPALVVAVLLFSSAAKAADPTTADCLAASDASLKSGNEHKLRAERGQLLICAAASCPSDIRKECLRRVDDVNASIPTVIFEAKDAAGNDLSAVKVTMDGELLAERLEGTALSIDPGEHTFVFETTGQSPLTKHFVIRESQKDRREAIAFGAAAATGTPPGGGTPVLQAPVPAAPSAPPAGPLPDAPLPAPAETHGLGTQKVLGIVAAGVGVVGLGVGGAFGLLAMSKKNDAHNICPNKCPTDAGVTAWHDAGTAANVSTALFIVGGVGLAAAAVLWFTAPSSSSTHVGVGPGGIQVKGTF